MTLCPYGSTVASGAPAFFTFDQSFLNANFATAVAAILTPALLGLPTGPQATVDFCSSEPSQDLPSAPDYLKLAFPLVAYFTGTYTRFGNQARNDAFNQYCACNPNPSGVCGTSPDPAGPWTFSSAGPAGTDFTMAIEYQAQSNGHIDQIGVYRISLADSDAKTLFVWINGTFVQSFTQTATSVTGYHWTPVSPPITYNSGDTVTIGVNFSNGYYVATSNVSLVGNTYHGLKVTAYKYHNGVSNTYPTLTPGGYPLPSVDSCVGGSPTPPPAPPPLTPPTGFPPAPTPPTCGSYQDICNNIQLIFNQLEGISELITILRDQQTPASLAESTVHSGLSGSGTITVSGILGVRVRLTSIPSFIGRYPDNPTTFINAAWVDWDTAEGWHGPYSIKNDDELIIPLSPLTTKIGYNFSTGVTGSITEIIRGP